MQTIILYGLLLTGTASAGCYSGGQPWNTQWASCALQAAASHFGGTTVPPNVEQVFEVLIPDYTCVKFILENISSDSRSIGEAEALDGFTKEYTGCQYGGDTSYTNWRYVYVPGSRLTNWVRSLTHPGPIRIRSATARH
jgi:hypothetical protein